MQLQFSDSHFFSTLFFVKLHHIALISVPSKLHDHAAALTKDMYTKKRIMLCKKVVHCTYKKTATFIFKFTYVTLCCNSTEEEYNNYMSFVFPIYFFINFFYTLLCNVTLWDTLTHKMFWEHKFTWKVLRWSIASDYLHWARNSFTIVLCLTTFTVLNFASI